MSDQLLTVIPLDNVSSQFPVGVEHYYTLPEGPNRQASIDLFNADQTRTTNGRIKRPRPSAETGKHWAVAEAAPTTETPTNFAAREVGPSDAQSSLSVYFAAPLTGAAGQTLKAVLVRQSDNVEVASVTMTYKASGYTRVELIDSTLAVPYYALLPSVPSGNYYIRKADAAGNLISQWPLTVTATGPVMALTATTTANKAPTVSNPVADRTVTVNQAVSFSIPENTFADSDGTVVSVTPLSLPPGLSWTPNGRIISGTPNQTGTYSIKLRATDNLGATINDEFILTVSTVGGDVCAIYYDGQLLIEDFHGYRIYARRTSSGVLFGEKEFIADGSREFCSRVFMHDVGDATGKISAAQSNCFAVTDPRQPGGGGGTGSVSMLTKRWLGIVHYGFYDNDTTYELHDEVKAIILATKAKGANMFEWGANWYRIDKGTYPGETLDWRIFDSVIKFAYDNGLKVAYRIGGTRQPENVDGFISPDARIRASTGQTLRHKGNYVASPHSAEAMGRLETFVRRCCQRIKDSPYANALLNVSFVLNAGMENDLPGGAYLDGGNGQEVPTITDYSPAALTAWRAQRGDTSAQLPIPSGSPPYIAFSTMEQRQFYDFREAAMAAMCVRMDSAIVDVLGSGVNRMVQMGSAWDDLSHLRGTSTILRPGPLDSIPGIKLNDAWGYNYEYSVTLSLRDRAAGRFAGVETDGIYGPGNNEMIDHLRRAFGAGASYGVIANVLVRNQDGTVNVQASADRNAAIVEGVLQVIDITQPRPDIATKVTTDESRKTIAGANHTGPGYLALFDQANVGANKGHVRPIIANDLLT